MRVHSVRLYLAQDHLVTANTEILDPNRIALSAGTNRIFYL